MALPLVPILVAAVPKLIDSIAGLFPDTKAKDEATAKLTAQLVEIGAQQDRAQAAINQTEAGHRSVFVAGWRPAIMWVCAFCVLYTFVIYPWLVFICSLHWPDYVWEIPAPPNEQLWALVFGVLGIGGMRTFEKFKGVSK